ncbi:hypothetical protein BC939DRAFT_457033 [Gamsiella multidivaricata]|uniref:uncharacterized protein n=1 Tax=Gamsiella multidivaricata TaxID=101098 RepID=UPI00221FC017|nr:uncharacterized protein BC939DRAFT_457033 [Gamsiella multidivaricata]KAG0371317.1 hypothetical protein BGZ54_006606 [Gamsiella multidivaricata]KAI7820817.1 hypothetical protein BC939DRAFT_457033 [Gamsiella multidivaricata]
MDLNWCPVCEQHIPLAWESSLYCSDRCKKADAAASNSGLYPAKMQSFSRNQRTSISSPLSSPSLGGVNSSTSATSTYPSPPTSPMSNYVYNNISAHGRISPPSFSLGQPASATAGAAGYDLQLRRKSATTIAVPQYTTSTSAANKKGFFW